MTNYLFDVDGTLTPPRGEMEQLFKGYFVSWTIHQQQKGDKVFFVTGSDKNKTIEQVGLPLWRFVDGSYQCCGNQLYRRGKLIKESSWQMSAYLRLDIMIAIEKSPWYGTADNNIEERAGMINISTIGRGANSGQRKKYYAYDQKTGERQKIVEYLSIRYPKLEFSVGGEISIDIHPKGKNKSQVLSDMEGKTVFFGDRCDPRGNDYSIASVCDVSHHVSNWQETCEVMGEYSR